MGLDEIIIGLHAMMEDMTGDPCRCRICQQFNDRMRLEQELEQSKRNKKKT